MRKSTLGLLTILVLFAGVLVHASGDAFAVVDRKPLSATDKKIEDDKIKAAEKRSSENTITNKTSIESVSKTTVSSGIHNTKIQSVKVKRGLQAISALPPTPQSVAKTNETKNSEDEKNPKSDSNSKSPENKSISKTMKSTGKHNNKITATKVQRGLAAQKTKQ